MRREFEMTEEQLQRLLAASKPTPVMYLSGGVPMGPSQQENANRAWRTLGQELGFNDMTVKPVTGKGPRHFTAETTSEPKGGCKDAGD